jgi:hypothetical protein
MMMLMTMMTMIMMMTIMMVVIMEVRGRVEQLISTESNLDIEV